MKVTQPQRSFYCVQEWCCIKKRTILCLSSMHPEQYLHIVACLLPPKSPWGRLTWYTPRHLQPGSWTKDLVWSAPSSARVLWTNGASAPDSVLSVRTLEGFAV